jgi:hypothetical protein
MKALSRGALLLFVVGGFAGWAQADGKFFAEKVPADIPYQRAFLIFHEGSETLVLQSKYALAQSAAVHSLGWVVPVPAIPSLASIDADVARTFFLMTSFRTQPDVRHISAPLLPIGVVLFLGGAVLLLVRLVEYPFVGRRPLITSAIATLAGFFLVGLTIPHLGAEGVEVVKAEKVGIYDIKVIRGETGEGIIAWLNENRFAFNDEDAQLFKEYVDRGWCFVVAKVEPGVETQERQIVAEGMVAPVIMKFETETAVYPLALTATTGAKTEVLIYTLSDKKLTCGERLKLRFAGKAEAKNVLDLLLTLAQAEKWSLLDSVPDKSMMLCKFKDRLTPAEMKQDLVFEFAPDNNPYREGKVVW